MTDQEKIKKLQEAKQKKAKIEGATEQLYQQLEKDFGLKSISEAEQRIKDLDKDIDGCKLQIGNLQQELDSIVDWNKI